MKKKKYEGFTLIELVVVMVIIGILAVVSAPMYRKYVQRAYAVEGITLVSAVMKAEHIYYAEYGYYMAIPELEEDTGQIMNGEMVIYNPRLGIDARKNKYFRGYIVELEVDGFSITSTGEDKASGVIVNLTQLAEGPPKLTTTYPL